MENCLILARAQIQSILENRLKNREENTILERSLNNINLNRLKRSNGRNFQISNISKILKK